MHEKKFEGVGFILSLSCALREHEFSHDRQLISFMFTGYNDIFKKPREIRDDELLPDDMIRWDKY
jgi:hypothetical protein